ncbi:retention module-containing protein, partial [Iodobacter sp. CM08]|uniref:retention module-containing protein n=1 Tax=Iodobacter sp. CM08 TaxID=3085902 RepID=UPI0029828A60
MAEQINTTQAHATIVQIDGKAYLRDASGKTVPLQKGQELNEAQTLVTDADGHVQLQMPNGQLVDIGPTRTVQIDAQMLGNAALDAATAVINDLAASTAKIAAAINNGQDLSTELEATAAGLGGAGQSEGHSFVQLLRVAEGVNPLAFNFATNFETTPNDVNPAQAILIAEQGIQAVNDAVTLEEDGQSRINVLGNDSGNNITVSSASASNGTVVINTDGTITYKPNANYNGPDQITYTITDATGAVSSATVAVTVTPVNDLPTQVDNNGNPTGTPVQIITKEDTPIAGKVNAKDPDGDTLTFAPKDQPTHGSVVVNPDGSYVYTPATDYNGKDSFTVTVNDGKGGTATIVVDVTVDPVNDAPVGTNQSITTPEDTPITGKLIASDKDGDTLTFAPKDQPTHGSVVVNPDGSYVYTPATDYNGKDSFTVTVNDGKGGTATIVVDITVDPVNDAPVGTNQSITTPEDTPITGKLIASDKDGDTLTFAPKDQPTHGSVVVNPDGSYVYTPATDYNGKDSFTVTVNDGKGGTAIITVDVGVTPVEDPANISGTDLGTVQEDGVLIAEGKLTVSDKDAGQSEMQPASIKNEFGTFAIDKDGKWSFTLDNNAKEVQALTSKDSFDKTFTVQSLDGTTHNVVVTIKGQDDIAEITPSKPGDDAGQVKEDTVLTTGGTLLVNDKDAGQSSFQAQTDTTGTYGKFSIGTDGKWTYALNNSATNVQALNEGETKTETFAVKSADGTTSNVIVTIVGTNDAAIITPSKPGDDAGQVKEDVTLTTGGTLLVNDKDAGQSSFQAQTDTSGTYGKFSIGTDGKWTYALNNSATNVQELKEGETKTETFAVKSADGTTSNVIVTIVGTNDAAIITPNKPGDDAGQVKEDVTLTTGGTLLVNDKDAGQSSFQAQTDTTGTYGKFSIGTDGKWTYVLNNSATNVQELKEGDTRTETFTVKTADGTSSTVTVQISGTNESATVGQGAVQEDTVTSSSGALTASGGATFVSQANTAGTYGSLTLGSDGKWTYTLNNAADNVQALKTGEFKTENFNVTLSDGSKTTITINVQGLDDKAIITPSKPGDDAGQVKEDVTLTTGGTLLVNDKDAGQSSFQAQTDTTGTYGKFSIGSDGKWTYVLNNSATNVQELKEGEIKTETFAVKSADGTTSNVIVTIVGTNDAAIITPSKPGDDAGQVKEDVTLTTGGTLLVNDKDAGQSSFQAQTDTTGTYGKFSIGSDGKWTYALNNSAANVQALNEGETKTETFAVKSADGTTSNVIVTIVGTNDAAIITPSKPGDDAGLVKEDTTLTTGGTLLVNDKDAGQSSFQAQTDTTGTYGKFSIGTDGKWTYALNNSATNVQELKEGETKTETFAVKSADGSTSNVTVTIVGTNDAAIITPSKPGDDAGLVKEDTTLTTGGTLLVNDKDAGQSSFQAQTDTTGTYGKFSIGSDGKWTYALNNSAANVQALNEGETKTETFAVKSADGTTSNVIVTIVGTNDAAIITPSKPGDDAGQVKEDVTLTTGGTLLVNDKDAGQSSFQAQTDTSGTYGKFSIGTDGKWTYALNNSATNVQELKEG